MDPNHPKPWFDDNDDLSSDDEVIIGLLVMAVVDYHQNLYLSRQTYRDDILLGHAYVRNDLEGNEARCPEMFWMERSAFMALCDCFRQRNLLKDTRHISIEIYPSWMGRFRIRRDNIW